MIASSVHIKVCPAHFSMQDPKSAGLQGGQMGPKLLKLVLKTLAQGMILPQRAFSSSDIGQMLDTPCPKLAKLLIFLVRPRGIEPLFPP
jgi:hypothetical protein